MKTYLISYDLGTPETKNDYYRIAQVIKGHIGWAKVLRSVWIIQTNRSRDEILRNIRSVTDYNDKILVIGITSDWISLGVSKEVTAWMPRNILS